MQVFAKTSPEADRVSTGVRAAGAQPVAKNMNLETWDVPIAAIRAGLSDTSLGGLVIVGPAGSGRRAVFDEALASLDPSPPAVHLTGSPYVAQMRHGVISFILSQLESGTFSTRHELVHGLADLLCPEGRRSVVTLGNPEQVDPDSAAILGQLAAMKKIWLVAVCERLVELPADLLAMHRSGQLQRVTVHSMDVRHTRRFLEGELGGPISMFAAAALWQLTSSNRDVLRPLVRDLVGAGKLRLQSGCWVLAHGGLRMGPSLRAQATRWMSGLDQKQRKVLDLLALGGPATSGDLRDGGLEEQIVGLRARGLVTVGELPVGQVKLRIPLLGHFLREGMDDGQRPEIETLLLSVHRDPQAARILTEVTAMRELGNVEALVAVVEEYDHHGGATREAWLVDGCRQMGILDQTIDALVVLGWHGRASARLARAQEEISAALLSVPRDEELLRARQTLRIMRAQMALVEGRPTAVEGILGGVIPAQVSADERPGTDGGGPLDTLWASEALHFRAKSVQAEAWAMTSRQIEALRMVQRIRADMDGLGTTGILDQVISEADCAAIELAGLRVQLLSGQWNECALGAQALAKGRYADPRAIAYADIVLGILGSLAAETGSALGVLLPAQQQLDVDAESTERAVVEAAVAYCLTEQGRGEEAVELLLKTPSVLERMLPMNFFSWAAEVLSSLALAGVGSPQAARRRVLTLVERAEKAGSDGLVIYSLVVALRLGEHDVAPRLKKLAGDHPGGGFRSYGRLARGMMEADSLELCETLEELSELGQTLHAGDASNSFIDAMSPKDRRRVAGARSRSHQGDGHGPSTGAVSLQEVTDEPAWLGELTKREAQIALRVVSGMSNAEIARQSGVSVRTVEGHLYQVYSKLQVRNRQELAGLDRASQFPVGAR